MIRNYVPEPSFKKRGNAENPALPDSINELIPLFPYSLIPLKEAMLKFCIAQL